MVKNPNKTKPHKKNQITPPPPNIQPSKPKTHNTCIQVLKSIRNYEGKKNKSQLLIKIFFPDSLTSSGPV